MRRRKGSPAKGADLAGKTVGEVEERSPPMKGV
jgi:hypothetical protein